MTEISDLMASCPLKQHIRQELWEPYIKKLDKKPIKYLTLYCPPLMDVKHFCNRGYIQLEDGVYKGAVGVTDVPQKGYSRTISEGKGRLKLLKEGVIYKLLETPREKDLVEEFPFDVINLDYCNQIYGRSNKQYISENLKDIATVIRQQSKEHCGSFILFITTRADKNIPHGSVFASTFKRSLSERIGLNIKSNRNFKRKYNQIFDNQSPFDIVRTNFDLFICVGIVKLVSMCLAAKNYTIKDCDAFWLSRTEGRYRRDLLHVALFVNKGKPLKYSGQVTYLEQLGTTQYIEKGSIIILDKIIDKKVHSVNERKDKARLQRKHGNYIASLRESFELTIPEPIPNE